MLSISFLEQEMRIMRNFGIHSGLIAAVGMGLISVGCSPRPTDAPPVTTDTTPATADTSPVTTDDLVHVEDGGADHKHAETYVEAVAMLTEYRDQIRDSFAKGDALAADPAVHEIGHTLEDVTALANSSSLSEEDQVAVGVAVEKLLDAYGAIDEKIHSNEEVKYDEVAGEIDSAMETLTKYADQLK